jgi:hypothetical protein
MPAGKDISKLRRYKIMGAILIAGALVMAVFNTTFIKKQSPKPPSKPETAIVKKTAPLDTKSPQLYDQKSRTRSENHQDNPSIVNALENMLIKEDFPGILDQLEMLSKSRSLNSIENLLKHWCRSRNGELAQWVLAYSKESDPKLHLKLCAEALTNPNQQMRETSAAELEVASGFSFSNTAEARSWLESLKIE